MLKKIICHFKGHTAINFRKLSSQSVRFDCERCGGDFAHNHHERITLYWSEELEEFYRTWEEICPTSN